ncbi:hypothetical protein [Antarctobacter jejuensis]|uniref:hypothetical protein n=1 Tax=Antarctobacter jejuensis TaxID=1439938 RepID=UPI003FD14E0D
MLEDGVKLFGGGALVRIVERATGSTVRAVWFGILSTTLLQSSSLVSVITISFLSAGLISLIGGGYSIKANQWRKPTSCAPRTSGKASISQAPRKTGSGKLRCGDGRPGERRPRSAPDAASLRCIRSRQCAFRHSSTRHQDGSIQRRDPGIRSIRFRERMRPEMTLRE